jgi:hypothetical protein
MFDIPLDFLLLANDIHFVNVELFPCNQKKIEPGESVKKSDKKQKCK